MREIIEQLQFEIKNQPPMKWRQHKAPCVSAGLETQKIGKLSKIATALYLIGCRPPSRAVCLFVA